MTPVDFVTGHLGGFWSWQAGRRDVRVCFTGKGPRLDRAAALGRVLPDGVEAAWLRQVHSAAVLDARPGDNGAGDALVTAERNRGLAVVTADCVPVLLAGGGRIAAVHAGWRGVAQAIVPAALQRFDGACGAVAAWIGPAIGQCCYEVGPDVAAEVVAASSAEVARRGRRGRPHLDLVAAVRMQLERGGVREVRIAPGCTRCDEQRLWSYRREGPGAGRNLAAIWRSG